MMLLCDIVWTCLDMNLVAHVFLVPALVWAYVKLVKIENLVKLGAPAIPRGGAVARVPGNVAGKSLYKMPFSVGQRVGKDRVGAPAVGKGIL